MSSRLVSSLSLSLSLCFYIVAVFIYSSKKRAPGGIDDNAFDGFK